MASGLSQAPDAGALPVYALEDLRAARSHGSFYISCWRVLCAYIQWNWGAGCPFPRLLLSHSCWRVPSMFRLSAYVFRVLIFLLSLPEFCFFTFRDHISAARSHGCAKRVTAGGCSPSSSRGVVRSPCGFTLLNLGLLRAFAFRQSRTFRSCPVPRLG